MKSEARDDGVMKSRADSYWAGHGPVISSQRYALCTAGHGDGRYTRVEVDPPSS